MKFVVERNVLLKPLQQVSNSLGNRPIVPILNNIFLQVKEDQTLLITGTDLEIEIVARVRLNEVYKPGATTVPGRKFFDICRSLPEGVEIEVHLEGDRMLIRSERSRYLLSTLPASNFPNLDVWDSQVELTIQQSNLKRLMEATQFSMAHQDVRYYLNGMLFETEGTELRTVATDGHRLAICTMSMDRAVSHHSAIVPRKGVMELMRMLNGRDYPVLLRIGNNNISVNVDNYIFTCKLIAGRFPDYRNVLFKNPNKILKADCTLLRQACTRSAILSNEKLRTIRLCLTQDQLKIRANNSAHEESEETLDVTYQDEDLEIGFNVTYILDVLNALKYCKKVKFLITDKASSIQIEDNENNTASYVVMPLRL